MKIEEDAKLINDQNPPNYASLVQNQESPQNTQSKCQKLMSCIKNNWGLLIFLLIVVVILILFSIPSIKNSIINWINYNINTLRDDCNNNKALAYLIIGFINFITTFFFPSKGLIATLTAFVLYEFWSSFLVVTLPTILAMYIGYYLTRYCCKDYFYNKYKDDLKFQTIEMIVRESPWKASFIVWILLLPTPLKIYVMSLTELTFLQYIIPGAIMLALYILLFVMVGISLTDLTKMTNLSWNGANSVEKVEFIVTISILVFTVSIMVWLGYWFNDKLKK